MATDVLTVFMLRATDALLFLASGQNRSSAVPRLDKQCLATNGILICIIFGFSTQH